jgi:hypothetical protein
MKMRQQRGMLLLALMAMIGLVLLASFVASLPDKRPQTYQHEQTAYALAQAKAALIGYAVSYAEAHPGYPPGYLPCPDMNGDGSANTAGYECGIAGHNAIGRLPWRTLGIEPLRDGDGELLWYVVSGNFKANSPLLGNVNPKIKLTDTTPGQLIIKDEAYNESFSAASSTTPAVALVFAAGRAVVGQNRSAANSNNPLHYLDIFTYTDTTYINNAEGYDSKAATNEAGYEKIQDGTVNHSVFVSARRSDIFNDAVSVVSREDIFAHIPSPEQWIMEKIIECVETYNPGNPAKYPWAAPISSGTNADANATCFGRIADDLSATAASGIITSWPVGCFDPSQTDGWWNQWKDSMFIAVTNNMTPAPNELNTAPLKCNNLKLDIGSPPSKNIELALFFAGDALPHQSRENAADKSEFTNYLEGKNENPNDQDFEYQISSPTFNDKVCYMQASDSTFQCLGLTP